MTSVTFPRESPIFSSEATSFKESYSTLPKSDRYSTHLPGDTTAELVYQLSYFILAPAGITLQLLAYVIEPLPGKDKDYGLLWGTAVRITSLVLFVLILPIGIVCLLPGLPLFWYTHTMRPYISVIDNSSRIPPSQPKDTLSVCSYNLGFVHEFMRIVGDLRPVMERVEEIPIFSDDVVCLQEAFHKDGTERICNRYKEKYPYIIHSVAPHGTSFPSGKIIASKYPVEEVTFRILSRTVGPEKWAPRGLLGVRVDLGRNRYANIYNAHLQSLLGQERAEVRVHQLNEVIAAIDEDHAADLMRGDRRTKVGDYLMGDLNLSLINAWGEENPCEQAGAELIENKFYNIRPTRGPTGSWYVGPFANRNMLFHLKAWFEEWCNGFSMGRQVVPLENPILWGTSKWNSGPRTANTALFDYQLVRKREIPPLAIDCEIVHVPTNAESAPSDHLPIRAVYEINSVPNDTL